MTKRPTFRELITAFGNASIDVGRYPDDSVTREQGNETLEVLLRALRKSGLPLDQVAPQ